MIKTERIPIQIACMDRLDKHCDTIIVIGFLKKVLYFFQENVEQLQQFGKPTWHPYNFGKIRKIGLQQFGKASWQK
jgi:hypothetical protein